MQDKKTRIAIEYMRELHRQSAFFDKILETLTAFSESEQKKASRMTKGSVTFCLHGDCFSFY